MFPLALCGVQYCSAKADNPGLVAPCGSFDCCDLGSVDSELIEANELLEVAVARAELAKARADQAEALCGETSDSGPTGDEIDPYYYTSGSEDGHVDTDSCRCDGKVGSIAIIIPVVLAAVLLVAAAVYLDRKRRVAGLQLHRESIPTIGGDAGVEG